MFDLRETHQLLCDESNCIKKEATYFSEDKLTGKKLIVKFIANYSDENDQKLITEFRKLVLLSGEPEIGTVHFLASGKVAGEEKSCYVMDYIDGKTLHDFLEENNELEFESALDIIKQIASGLEKAHHYGVFHHDLHSRNIMINEIGYVKIIDFLFLDMYKDSFQKNVNYDLVSFLKLADLISERCTSKKSLRILSKYLSSIRNFKGLSKNIKALESIIFDLSLLNTNSKGLLSRLIYRYEESKIPGITILKYQNLPIPERYLIIVEDFLKIPHIDEDLVVQIECLRETEKCISTCMNKLFEHNFIELNSIGLISWSLDIKNKGTDFTGPHKFTLDVRFNPKLIRWIKVNKKISFIHAEKEGLEEFIFRDPLE